MEILKKNIGGLPVGVWLLIIAAGVGAGVVLRKRGQAQADNTDTSGPAGSTDTSQTVPYDALPSDPYSYFPAGGPPVVSGQTQAIRLQPPVLRIRVIQPHARRHHRGRRSANDYQGPRGVRSGANSPY